MCLFIVLLFGIVFAIRVPFLIRAQPASGVDTALYSTWKRKELRSYYFFLAGSWGALILVLIGYAIVSLVFKGPQQDADSILGMISVAVIVPAFVCLVWAALLSGQAAKLKKQWEPATRMPPSYYPRPGQELMQAPPLKVEATENPVDEG